MRALAAALVVCFTGTAAAQPEADDSDWAVVLSSYGTADGGFRYAALHASATDRARLARFVAWVGETDVSAWPRDRALAFYVDAYHALVLSAVIERWPIESVMRVPGFFDRVRHRVGGRTMTLNQLENDVLRSARFGDPRVHFVLNCASASCPPRARRPYAEGDLEARLDGATRRFVRRTTRVSGGVATVSRLFEWYAADFERGGGARAFVSVYLDAPLEPSVRLVFAEYDWDLDDRP